VLCYFAWVKQSTTIQLIVGKIYTKTLFNKAMEHSFCDDVGGKHNMYEMSY